MKFHVGQRVRVVAIYDYRAMKYKNEIASIVSVDPLRGENYEYELDLPTGLAAYPHWYAPASSLRPVDDPADFQRFMERVMKPVDLRKPVTA